MQTTANHNASANSPFRGIKGVVFCIFVVLLLAHCKPQRHTTLTTTTTAAATDSIKDKLKADSILAADSLRIRLKERDSVLEAQIRPFQNVYDKIMAGQRPGKLAPVDTLNTPHGIAEFNKSARRMYLSPGNHFGNFQYHILDEIHHPVIQKLFPDVDFFVMGIQGSWGMEVQVWGVFNHESYRMPNAFGSLEKHASDPFKNTIEEKIECLLRLYYWPEDSNITIQSIQKCEPNINTNYGYNYEIKLQVINNPLTNYAWVIKERVMYILLMTRHEPLVKYFVSYDKNFR